MSRENHEAFIKRLENSSAAVFRVAEWIYAQGWSVKIPAIRYAPYGSNPLDYVDDGDIYMQRDGDWERIDVKHLTTDFTDITDWPYNKTIVSSQIPVDRANPPSKAYIIVNKAITHAAIVWRATRKHWYVEELYATNYKRNENFYICPNEYVEFRKITND